MDTSDFFEKDESIEFYMGEDDASTPSPLPKC